MPPAALFIRRLQFSKNNSDSAFSLTGRFGGVASNGGIILAKSGTKTYGYTFTYKLGFPSLK